MERKREKIEALGLPTRVNNILKKRIGFIDALVSYGEEGLREIDGIGDASITAVKEAMKNYGVNLPVEKAKRLCYLRKHLQLTIILKSVSANGFRDRKNILP